VTPFYWCCLFFIELVEYEIKIKKGAGASNVPLNVTLHGDKGTSESVRLESKSDSLIDINKDESIKVKAKNVGKIDKMSLMYEAEGLKSVWYLNEIQVKVNDQVVLFPVEKAFTNSEKLELKPNEKPSGIDVKSKTT
jgi:hypothetical protein